MIPFTLLTDLNHPKEGEEVVFFLTGCTKSLYGTYVNGELILDKSSNVITPNKYCNILWYSKEDMVNHLNPKNCDFGEMLDSVLEYHG